MARPCRILLAWLSLTTGACSWAQGTLQTQMSPTSQTSQLPQSSDLPDPGAIGTGKAAATRGWEITPSIGLDLTQTDNATLQRDNRQSDLIVRTSPGIRVLGESARAKGYVDLRLQQIDYMQSEGRDRTQRTLNGMGTLELVDNWLYLDLGGRIARQAISAFGRPDSGSDSFNQNMTETTMYQVSPYIKGRLLGQADYQLRFDNTWYSAKNGPLRDTMVQSVQGNLSGATGLSLLSWGLLGSAQQTTYSNDLRNEANSLRGTLTYAIDPQLHLTVIGGRESNDYINFRQQTTSISGWGANWSPTERTQIAWRQENRYFGKSHSFAFAHRTPHTTWRITDSRDAMLRAPQTMSFAMGTYFDLLNEQLRTTIPDNLQRTTYILALLQTLGIAPDANVIGGFQTSRVSINRVREASVLWNGVRNMVTLSVQSIDRTALGTGIEIPDDFANFSSTIRQKGVTINWAHKLTPLSTLTLMGNRAQTTGNSSNQETDRTMYSLMFSTKLGAHSNVSVGVRRTEVTGFVDYVENAVLASLLMMF